MSITEAGTRRDETTAEDATLHPPADPGRFVEAIATAAPDRLPGRSLPIDL
jgi:hypothetical protein